VFDSIREQLRSRGPDWVLPLGFPIPLFAGTDDSTFASLQDALTANFVVEALPNSGVPGPEFFARTPTHVLLKLLEGEPVPGERRSREERGLKVYEQFSTAQLLSEVVGLFDQRDRVLGHRELRGARGKPAAAIAPVPADARLYDSGSGHGACMVLLKGTTTEGGGAFLSAQLGSREYPDVALRHQPRSGQSVTFYHLLPAVVAGLRSCGVKGLPPLLFDLKDLEAVREVKTGNALVVRHLCGKWGCVSRWVEVGGGGGAEWRG